MWNGSDIGSYLKLAQQNNEKSPLTQPMAWASRAIQNKGKNRNENNEGIIGPKINNN